MVINNWGEYFKSFLAMILKVQFNVITMNIMFDTLNNIVMMTIFIIDSMSQIYKLPLDVIIESSQVTFF